tara:strand:+ start:3936 stop:5303 length:1368 start_codon:yes stop_codon:yes gene_type:complete
MGNVHFISIGGSVMHSLAISLKNIGYNVTGSDDKLYEPSLSRLITHDLKPKSLGWNTNNINHKLDFIILGMHAKLDNPELLKAQDLELDIYSYPDFIFKISKNKTRIVIGGSHGKTSITSMILHVLNKNNINVDYVLGAQLDGFENTVSISDENEFIIIEGDEYLSSPIDLSPKFHKYKANIALISGISWDHINVFESPMVYSNQFSSFINTIIDGGILVYNELDSTVKDIVSNNDSFVRKIEYGMPDYKILNNQILINTDEGEIPLQVFGKHNLSNIEGARKICSLMGVFDEDFYNSISSFTGASKRLQIIYNDQKNLLIRDFAHSPSKLTASVSAVKETFNDSFIICVYELHTFSSLNLDFINQYSGTLDNCDLPIVFFDKKNKKLDSVNSINHEIISNAFGIKNLNIIDNSYDLFNYLISMEYRNTCLLLMSSGNFGSMSIDKLKHHISNEN